MARPSVLAALHAAFEAAPALATAIPGGLWTGEVPERDPDTDDPIAKPYARVDLEGTDYEWLLGTAGVQHTKLCFTVVAVGGEACERALNALEDAFTWGDLTYPGTSAAHVKTVPLRRDQRADPVRDPDGNVLHVGVLLYEVQTFLPES